MRIVGVEIPDNKKINIGLTYLFGIGRKNVGKLVELADLDPDKRIKELTDMDVSRIQKALDGFKIEGDLRQEIGQNIRRLEEIGSYRGSRHRHGLPSRGQRTRSNARTLRGKRKTVGSLKKEVAQKT